MTPAQRAGYRESGLTALKGLYRASVASMPSPRFLDGTAYTASATAFLHQLSRIAGPNRRRPRRRDRLKLPCPSAEYDRRRRRRTGPSAMTNFCGCPPGSHGRQRPLRYPAPLQEARDVAAAPELRDPQLDGSSPGMPTPVAITSAPIDPLGCKADHFAQHAGVRRPLQQHATGDLVVGHRGDLGSELRFAAQPVPATLPHHDRARPFEIMRMILATTASCASRTPRARFVSSTIRSACPHSELLTRLRNAHYQSVQQSRKGRHGGLFANV